MFGIVSVLDQAYAATPGGRAELVMGASSPELQVSHVASSYARA
jgi:hypothetical protein